MSGTNCMEQIARNENTKNNKDMALHYIESTPNIEFNDEKEFLVAFINRIDNNSTIPYVMRNDLEKEYVYKRIESLKEKNEDVSAVSLLEEFDNVLCFFIANGLIEVPNNTFDKLYVNEEQLKRVENRYFKDNGKSYTKGPKK